MKEQTKEQETQEVRPEQPSGIFEPKPLNPADIPRSGTQKAITLAAVIGVLVLIACIVTALRNPFMKPVKQYYKGFSADDADKMGKAFPGWLLDARVTEDTMTVYEMCSAMLSEKLLNYGEGQKIKAALAAKTPVEEDYLHKIADGIQSTYHVPAEVTKGYRCTLHVTYEVQGGKPYTATEYVRVYRINGKWVMLDVPSDQA